jgi:hypothetical protein
MHLECNKANPISLAAEVNQNQAHHLKERAAAKINTQPTANLTSLKQYHKVTSTKASTNSRV